MAASTTQSTSSITTIHVRQAGLADVDVLAPLFDGYRQFYGQAQDLVLARAFIHERLALLESVIFLAEDGEAQALGFTQLYPSFTSVGARRTWILNDLFVSPAARGRGTGSALLDAARRHAIATGAKRLVLSTAYDNPAQKLYESQGYARNEGFYHYSLALD
jgi:GNAT superfamily N-acetyltransferase